MVVSQEHFIELAIRHGMNPQAIAEELRSDPDCDLTRVRPYKIQQRLENLIRKGLLPLESGNYVGRGEVLRGTSTFYDEDGSILRQWVKTDVPKQDMLLAFQSALENLADTVKPVAPQQTPLQSNSDLLVKFPIADAHIGLLTWHKEVGQDFDLEIAKHLYVEGFTRLVECAPAADTCLILDLGDTIHSDDSSNTTKASKHQLDVDGRFDKLFDMTLHILCTMIDISLTKYQNVIFRKTRGNHDPDASVGIGAALAMRYRDEPRVTIERSPNLFWWYQFGKTLHFSTHGHTVRRQTALPEIAAHDCKAVWSDCDYVYVDTGQMAA